MLERVSTNVKDVVWRLAEGTDLDRDPAFYSLHHHGDTLFAQHLEVSENVLKRDCCNNAFLIWLGVKSSKRVVWARERKPANCKMSL
mmetsp:Transcript_14657/g.24842  ORF Transcript_14657/g.24842 Transcript_14657/m.24842 type:complete len:87 (+) Transcript_14657:48-308(+)